MFAQVKQNKMIVLYRISTSGKLSFHLNLIKKLDDSNVSRIYYFSLDVVEISKHCILHYNGYDSYSEIKDVSEITHQWLRETKAVREQLKDDNYHKEQ